MFLKARDWFRHQSLTFRLSVSISVCVLIGAVGLWTFLAHHSQPIIRAHIESLARHPLSDVVTEVQSEVWNTENAALTVKNTLKELPRTDVSMMQHLLHSAMQTLIQDDSDVAHAWVYVFNDEDVSQGTMYSATIKDNSFEFNAKEINNFYTLYPWFKAVPKEEAEFWSEPYVAEEFSAKMLVSTCLIPFKFVGSDKFDGLVAVSLDIDAILKDIANYEAQGVGKFLLMSELETYVVNPDPKIGNRETLFEKDKERNSPELQKISSDLKNGVGGNIELPAAMIFDSATMLFYEPLQTWKWSIGLAFSKKDFTEPLRDLQIKTITSMIAGLLLLLLLINFICRRSTKSLLDLSKVAVQYGKGNFDAELPQVVSKDEIGVMTEAFYNMRKNLLEYINLVRSAASEKQRSQSELEIAQQIQQSALPVNFPVHKSFEISAMMTAAKKVGGDFYDFFFIDETHFAVVIADVSGKGIPAALYMMNAKALIRSTVKTGAPLAKVFAKVNNELCRGNTSMFVTAFLAVLNLQNGELNYINAGHNPPYYRNSEGYKMLPVKRNIVLGGVENYKFVSETLKMGSGDRLFLYTDGVNEAQNNQAEFYGDERLLQVLNGELQSPFDALNQIKNDVAEFTQGAEQSDDLTMLELLYCQVPENTIALEAQVKNIDRVLTYVEQDIQKKKIAKKIQDRVMIITEEVFSNIAQYAYRKTGIVRLYSQLDDDCYKLCFMDNGPEYNPENREMPNINLSAEERAIGGLGIFLVRKMADNLEYQRLNGQNVLNISIRIPAE